MAMGKEKWETWNWALSEKLCHEHLDGVSWGDISRKDINVFIHITLRAQRFTGPSPIRLYSQYVFLSIC